MQRWLDGLRDVAHAASQLSTKTRVISVMDREADFFELFDEQRREGRVDVLVRAKHDRRLDDGISKLFATLRNALADGYVEIEIDRLSERRKSSRKQARPAPGHQLMWRGYERMSTATLGYRIAQRQLSGPDST